MKIEVYGRLEEVCIGETRGGLGVSREVWVGRKGEV